MKLLKIIVAFLFVIPIAGCWDRGEVTEFAFPISIGLDRGKKGLLEVTLEMANVREGSPMTMGKDDDSAEVITLTAPDILIARELANVSVTKDIQYSHLKDIIISEDLARTKEFEHILEAFLRDRQVRRDLNIIVTREKASDFIKSNDPKLEPRTHKFYERMVKRWEQTGLMPEATLNRYLQSSEGEGGLFLSIYATSTVFEPKQKVSANYIAGEVEKEGGNPTQMIGSAIFHQGHMVGVLDGEETRIALLLRPYAKVDTMLSSFRDPLAPSHQVTVRILKTKSPKVELNKDSKELNVVVPLTVQVLHIPSGKNYVEKKEYQRKLVASFENELESSTKKLITKTQQAYQAEPFLWAAIARQKFWTWDEYEKQDWSKLYSESNVNVKYDVTIDRFGKHLNSVHNE
ncbi:MULTISPECIES: Ger(x)C family spore germination protein [Bacillus]|uniref:Ger(x)C family spore germination protein n=1 Tax=Bacillus TaxID=1386 RepID=UPI0012FEBAC4|nr:MULTISPECIES: Ger(x)C family spore germination protein [Bacillus]